MSFYGNNTLIRLSGCPQNLRSALKTRCYVFQSLNLPVIKYSLHRLILPFSCEKLNAIICYRFFLLETMDTTKKQVMRRLQICKEWEELRVTPPLPWAARITLNTGTGRKEEYYLLKTASQEVEVMEVPKLLMWGTLHLVTSTDQVIGPNSSLWEGLLKSLSHPVHRMNVTKSGKWVWKIIPCMRVQQYWAIWGGFGCLWDHGHACQHQGFHSLLAYQDSLTSVLSWLSDQSAATIKFNYNLSGQCIFKCVQWEKQTELQWTE